MLLTWNMQGSNASNEDKWNLCVAGFLTSGGVDVACLQECGAIPASAKVDTANFGGAGVDLYTWNKRWVLFYPWDTNAHRVNLAIVSRNKPDQGTMCWPTFPNPWRPTIGIRLNQNWFFSVHAISPGGPDAAALVNAARAAAGARTFVAAGDFNREPDSYAAGALQAGTVICPPNKATHSTTNPTKKYDYAMKSWGPAVTGTVQTSMVYSDHYPVTFAL